MRTHIINKTVAGETANQVDLRIVNMPLYPSTTSTVDIFYGYYKPDNKRIENHSAEGNYALGNVVSGTSKTNLLNALTSSVGAVVDATLIYHQLGSDEYTLRYQQGGNYFTKKLIGNYITEDATIKASMLTNLSDTEDVSDLWLKRKSFTVNIGASQKEYPVTIVVHNDTGTDSGSNVYIGANVRADWGDIRILANDNFTRLPFAIVKSDTTTATITISANLVSGDNIFYLYYNRPQKNEPYKIACLTDIHYDAGSSTSNRNQSLDYIDNFVTRMATYLPDLAVNNGDKTGASNSYEPTQQSWYQAVMDHFSYVTATVKKDGVAPGNHDFQFLYFASIVSKHTSETWLESGKLYGYWESANFRFISLDSNYFPNTQTHMNFSHQGFGYINTDQIAWLESVLLASTKPCIIFCHHGLCDIDTAQITLPKEIYHTQNRVAVRAVLENSGKVVVVIHGHNHLSRLDVIKDIPYLLMTNISNDGLTWDSPVSASGKWSLIEIDKESRVIIFKTECSVSGTIYVTNEHIVPYKTIFDIDYANNPEKVYSYGYGAVYDKSSVVSNPAQLYINNYNYIVSNFSNLYDLDPRLSGNTMKLQGLTNSPNFGIATWDFAPQDGKFKIVFSARLTAQTTKYFKIHNNISSVAPAIYFGFNTAGNIIAFNGASSSNLQSYSLNTWYEITIKVDCVSRTFSVIINGSTVASNYNFNNINSSLKKLEITTETGVIFLDFLRIEKYLLTEPSMTSWGSVENLQLAL